jgi:hypothetical protein
VSGNPRRSDWYSTPRDARRRKPVALTLSDAARARLDELAEARGESRSATVEALVLAAHSLPSP